MKKRILSGILAAATAATLLAGCGGNSAASSAAKPADQSSAPSSAAASQASSEGGTNYQKFDDVKLKMLICWNGGYPTAKDQYNNEVAKKIREKIGVSVEFEGIMMSEVEKLNLMFASGDMPDIVNAPYWGGSSGETEVIKKAGAQGRLIDVKDKLANYPNVKHAFDIGVISQNYLENDINDPSFNGATYIIPQECGSGTVESINNWMYGIFVRGDVGKTLGIDPTSIKTEDQLYDFMKKAKAKDFKDVNGNDCIVASTYHEGWDYSGYQIGFTNKKTSDFTKLSDGSWTYDALTDKWVDRQLFIWKLVKEGLLDKECFKTTDEKADEKVGNGTALLVSTQYSKVVDATKKTGLYDKHPEMRYTWVGPLNYADGTPLRQTETEGRSGSPAIFFPTSCKNVDAALTWLDYLNSEEGCKLVAYGVEGDTYKLNADGKPRMTDEWVTKYKANAEDAKKGLREKGVGYYNARTLLSDKSMSWFGESAPFASDAAVKEEEEYKKIRPVEIIKGYPVSALQSGYKNYDTLKEFAFEGTTQKDYSERAFFAGSEAEAKSILKDYQNYLLTQQNGMFKDFLAYLKTAAEAKGNVVQ